MKYDSVSENWNRCECGQKNNKDRWSVYRIYKGIDSIVDVDGTFRDKNDKKIEVGEKI